MSFPTREFLGDADAIHLRREFLRASAADAELPATTRREFWPHNARVASGDRENTFQIDKMINYNTQSGPDE